MLGLGARAAAGTATGAAAGAGLAQKKKSFPANCPVRWGNHVGIDEFLWAQERKQQRNYIYKHACSIVLGKGFMLFDMVVE